MACATASARSRQRRRRKASLCVPTPGSGSISCPALPGSALPIGRLRRAGRLIGLTAECGLPEIARATLEAVGYQTRDLVQAMAADSGIAVSSLRVDGGMAASDWTMQFLADILPAVVERPSSVETTAWGAAYVAGLDPRPLSRAGHHGYAVAARAPLRAAHARGRTQRTLRRLAARRCRGARGGAPGFFGGRIVNLSCRFPTRAPPRRRKLY